MAEYDARIAEAEAMERQMRRQGFDDWPNCVARLVTALREAQAHVPPEGWRAAEWTHESGAVVAPSNAGWVALPITPKARLKLDIAYPTAAAAMAAIEEIGK